MNTTTATTATTLRPVGSGTDLLVIARENFFRSDAFSWGWTIEKAFVESRVRQFGDTATDLLLHLIAKSVRDTEHGTLEEACDELARNRGSVHRRVNVRRNAEGEETVSWFDDGNGFGWADLEDICKHAQLPVGIRPSWYHDTYVHVYIDGPLGGKWVSLWELGKMWETPSGRGDMWLRIDDLTDGDWMCLEELKFLTDGKLPMPLDELATKCKNLCW